MIITTTGGNLFQLAAQYLGNAMQWIAIARANDLSDPFVAGQVALVIPPIDPTASDGIAAQ